MKCTLAAIDIGSNGARLLIKAFDDEAVGLERVRKLMFVRVPLRLGKDVFTLGKVSKEREEMMIHDEALLLVNNLVEKTDSNEGNFAYVDVGGGSTEISLIHDGTLAESHSYNIGTLRLLSDRVTPEAWKAMEADLQGYAKLYPDIHIIGSGGNINKLFKISKESKNKKLSITELQRLYSMLKPMSIEERMISFNLKDDRADVIVPAARIFLDVSKQLGCDEIMVPNISLADSIVDGLYRDMKTAKVKP